ncbi:MAG: diguanylate cyclase [Pirellulales bacterium]
MTSMIIDLILPVVTALAGLAGGWWLFGRTKITPTTLVVTNNAETPVAKQLQPAVEINETPATTDNSSYQQLEITEEPIQERRIEIDQSTDAPMLTTQQMRELLEQVENVTETVRSDVGSHSTRMKELNSGLSKSMHESSSTLTDTITLLIEANNTLESRLDNAEIRLIEQSDRLNMQLEEARTDLLTGLPNRRVFDKSLRKCYNYYTESRRPTCLLMLDIDNFKHFNDTYGHQLGDEVLRQIGVTLRELLHNSNAIIARYGGEEFGVIMPGSDIFDAKITAARINRSVRSMNIQHENQDLHITTSVGISELSPEDDLSLFVKRADLALYAAKEAGRDRAFWHDGLKEQPVIQDENPNNLSERSEEVLASTGISNQEVQSPQAQTESFASDKTEFIHDLKRRLTESTRTNTPLSMVMIGIDQLDRIVSENGKQAESLVLNVMKQLLNAVMRDSDHVCQLENGQYGILLPTADLKQSSLIAERLRKAVTKVQLKLDESRTIQFTISTGVTESLPIDEYVNMINRSTAALRRSRISGGNQVSIVRSNAEEKNETVSV